MATPTETSSHYPLQPAWLIRGGANSGSMSALKDRLEAADTNLPRPASSYPTPTQRAFPKASGGYDFHQVRQMPADLQRGYLCAVVPGGLVNYDMLEFSRFPPTVGEQMGANIPSEKIAGRSSETHQHNGGTGMVTSLDLWFFDSEIYDVISGKHQGASANVARRWFQAYTIGHDGTGASIPYVEIYYALLAGDPVRCLLESAELTLEHFLGDMDMPQSVHAQVKLKVHEPVLYVNPFKLRDPPAEAVRKRSKPKVGACGKVTVPTKMEGGGTTRNENAAAETALQAAYVFAATLGSDPEAASAYRRSALVRRSAF